MTHNFSRKCNNVYAASTNQHSKNARKILLHGLCKMIAATKEKKTSQIRSPMGNTNASSPTSVKSQPGSFWISWRRLSRDMNLQWKCSSLSQRQLISTRKAPPRSHSLCTQPTAMIANNMGVLSLLEQQEKSKLVLERPRVDTKKGRQEQQRTQEEIYDCRTKLNYLCVFDWETKLWKILHDDQYRSPFGQLNSTAESDVCSNILQHRIFLGWFSYLVNRYWGTNH